MVLTTNTKVLGNSGITSLCLHIVAIVKSTYLTCMACTHLCGNQGRIQDLIKGGAPDRDRPKTAILGPQFCRILVLGPHFWWSGGDPGPRGPPPGSAPG